MAWLSVQSAQLSMGGRALVNNITLNINAGDRIGIVGPNGMGKSTFLGLLSGAIEPDSGSIKVMGAPYITQLNQWQKPSCSTIWACAADANSQLRQTQEQLQHVEQAMANPDMTSEQLIELTEQWGRLSEKFSDMGGYEWEATVRAGLIALGFAESRFNDSPQHLSGGEQHRLALLQIILSGADIWLLDEPNNHLDVNTLQWLEEQIRRFRGACVVVSHDRAFLDHIATRIVSWEDGFFWSTAGNWTKYRNLREERLKTEEAQYQRLQEERLRLEQYIARFRSGTRAKQAQSRMKRLEKLGTGTAPSTRPRDLQLLHNSSGHSGHEPLAHIQSLVLKRPHRVWEPLSFKLPPHAKVALIGPNGTGKSTLLEALTVPRSEVHWMQDTAIGYLPQDAVTKLPQGVTGMDYLYDQGFVREEIYYLGSHFGLSKDLLESMIDGWSGGERTRLKLLEVLMQPTDLLLLDEPTNHLDIRMRLALESLIIGYPGAVIISSHDRAFLQATSTHTLWSTGSAFIWDKDPYREGRIAPRTS
ncbi:ABC-F family ATP-binding cassette domain-containing protein [Sulfobacillus sp. hq2]|uniref:ABC-F family ATP-binding cassette domain-containing protein n=1 Tax=Sulfobacillus sp. hq2 TaxID=2039167 RepID=UPI000CD1F2A1|nr:ABC-F family ATP-binding cassette domain-containing protein [Sulfobacillus sp. hq2]POB12143.1 hypothetical protein CO251_01670 [Sulfobacillus sp. hq2]